MNTFIPPTLSRRLVLSLLGFRYRKGYWWRGRIRLAEEQVDRMTDAQWTRAVGRWGAVSAN